MSELKIEKAIITGPTGAVGISLINELLSKNIRVTAVCRPESSGISRIPEDTRLDIVQCDISELMSLTDRLDSDYDAFFHFAWDGTYGESRLDSERQSANVKYTLDAVGLASRLNCKVFVGAGSQSEFGHVDGVLKPDMPCNPDNSYGRAKPSAGIISRDECRRLGIRHEWCRIVSLYGPYDREYTMVMSTVIKMLRGERASFTDAEQIWDYIYSKDSATAFRLVAEKGVDGSVYCFGTGKTRKLRDFITVIRDTVNPDLEMGFGELEYYPNQVMHLEADISNLTADTGFIPQYSFEQGIKETVEWAKDFYSEKEEIK